METMTPNQANCLFDLQGKINKMQTTLSVLADNFLIDYDNTDGDDTLYPEEISYVAEMLYDSASNLYDISANIDAIFAPNKTERED